MKNLFYGLAILLLGACGRSVSNGDKVNLDRYNFTASFRDLPRNPMDTSYHTYSVTIDYGLITRLALRPNELEDQVQLAGWRRLPYNAHVQVQVKFEDLIIQSSEVKKHEQTLKDKDGKEYKKTTYTVEVGYTFAAQAKVADYRGRYAENYNLASRDQRRVHRSAVFNSAAEANIYSKVGLVLLASQLTRESMNNALASLSGRLTDDYGYPERTVSDYFWVVNSRQHPEFENHRRAWATFRQAIANMSPDEPLDEVKQQLQPVIAYYNKVVKDYSSDSKGDKKMRYASHFNLAKIYWFLDDPDAAIRHANELIINGYDTRDGYGLEAGAVNLKNLMRQSKIYTRHFRVHVFDYEGPDVASE